jgi:tRNA (adenine57-N1/adenine58-N1)-methyltransferase
MEPFFSATVARAGACAIIYESVESIRTLTLTPGKTFHNKFGIFRHDDFIDKPFGSKIFDSKETGFVYLLGPTAELWTKALKMRTQILYRADISLIISALDVKPGKLVVESGTGSGSLSCGLARAVMPQGKLYTYEFNPVRAELAAQEFAANGLSDFVVSEHRDVVEGGFAHAELEAADAIFLDLPSPWLAAHHAAAVLKQEGRLCSFSPCIEQVQKMCTKLRELGFHEIRTFETLLRPFHVKRTKGSEEAASYLSISGAQQKERGHTGYLTFASK